MIASARNKALTDRVHAYAERVLAGNIAAGPHVRAQCARHLRDLDELPGHYYDPQEAERGVNWFERYLRLGDQPFALFDWQTFWAGSAAGWKREDGTRRYRTFYVETGKGSGKTPEAAGMALRAVCADNEYRAEGYVCARTMDQALVTYRDIVALVEDTPSLNARCRVLGVASPYNIVYPATRSFLRRLAAQERGEGRSGYRPHVAVIDEYHEHATAAMVDMMAAGFKARKQPMLIITTNAGTSLTSACGIEHEYACRVAAGTVDDPAYFPYVCALDDDDDIEDRDVWIKTNPSLPTLPGYDYIDGMLTKARGMPSKRAVVERLLFCKWSEAATPWIDPAIWYDAESDDITREGDCYGALDLGARLDLSAGMRLWDHNDGTASGEVTIWTPEATLDVRAEDDQAPYRQWADEGYLIPVPGSVMDFGPVAEWLRESRDKYGMEVCAYDPWRIAELKRELEDREIAACDLHNEPDNLSEGLRLVPHPQGFTQRGKTGLHMPTSIDTTERMLHQRQVRVLFNPAMRSAMLGAVTAMDQSLNRRFLKLKSKTRIDPAVTLAMATGAMTAGEIVNALAKLWEQEA